MFDEVMNVGGLVNFNETSGPDVSLKLTKPPTFMTSSNKKLSYRRETARQLRMYIHRLGNLSCNAQHQTPQNRRR